VGFSLVGRDSRGSEFLIGGRVVRNSTSLKGSFGDSGDLTGTVLHM
jgi:hypothetical protein